MRLNTELMERSAARDAVVTQLGYTKPGFKWATFDPTVRITRYERGAVKEVIEKRIEIVPPKLSARQSGLGDKHVYRAHREHIIADDSRGAY